MALTNRAKNAVIIALADPAASTELIEEVESGISSTAFGPSTGGVVEATAPNSAQFGPGSNSQADSTQFGSAGIRLKGTTGAPSNLQNGDIWVDNGYMYLRSDNASVKL